MDKLNFHIGEINSDFFTNKCYNFRQVELSIFVKLILQLGQIHLEIWTNAILIVYNIDPTEITEMTE